MNSRDIDAGFALFSLPGWRRQKLQLLRWLAHDQPQASAPVLGLLRRALTDADWELRVTAMLTAARLQASALAPLVAKLVLPDDQRLGLSADELRLMHALRDATLAQLGIGLDRALPPGVALALHGDGSGLRPGLAACVQALGQPLPDDAPPAPATPGIVLTDSGPQLADGRLLVWVPPLPHWLGDETLRNALPNPPRRQRPAAGFFIDAEVRACGSWAQASADACREAQRLGRAVALADREAWEMAARGPDGRRFPWGMNAEPAVRADLSPWGMAGVARGDGEWLASADDGLAQHEAAVAGGRRNPAAARHIVRPATELRAYRFSYRLQAA